MKSFAVLAVLAALLSDSVSADHHHPGMGAYLRARSLKRRLNTHQNVRRKVIGWGDSTTLPDTVAKGSDSSACTCWHQVASGEVCLGLIDKSSAGFTLEKFFQLNPSLNNDCSNLKVGLSYCVDTGVNTYPSGTKAPTVTATATAAPSPSKKKCVATYEADDDEDEDEDQSESQGSGGEFSVVTRNVQKAQYVETAAAAPVQQAITTAAPVVAAVVATTTSAQQQQQQTQQQSSSGSGSGQTYTGTSTFYYQNGVAGSCGTVATDSSYVAALFTNVADKNANCGRKVRVTNTVTGASVEVTVRDTCPTCSDNGHIDLSVAAFQALGTLDQGLLQTKWQFIS